MEYTTRSFRVIFVYVSGSKVGGLDVLGTFPQWNLTAFLHVRIFRFYLRIQQLLSIRVEKAKEPALCSGHFLFGNRTCQETNQGFRLMRLARRFPVESRSHSNGTSSIPRDNWNIPGGLPCLGIPRRPRIAISPNSNLSRR